MISLVGDYQLGNEVLEVYSLELIFEKTTDRQKLKIGGVLVFPKTRWIKSGWDGHSCREYPFPNEGIKLMDAASDNRITYLLRDLDDRNTTFFWKKIILPKGQLFFDKTLAAENVMDHLDLFLQGYDVETGEKILYYFTNKAEYYKQKIHNKLLGV